MSYVIVDITDFLGLLSHISVTFWLGLVLITFWSIILYLDDELDCDFIFILIAFILGLYLFGLGVLVEENARAWSSYYPTAEVNNILIFHHIDTLSTYPVLSYRYWPAFHLLSAYILNITNLKLIYLIKYMPLFWLTCYILISFAIGKRFGFSSNNSFLLVLIANSSFIQCFYYYSPNLLSGLGYILLFWVFLYSQKRYNIEQSILLILVFFSVIITHLLTTIVLISSFVSTRSIAILHNKRYFISMTLIFVFFLSWYMYLAPIMFEYGIMELINQTVDLDFFNYFQSTKYSSTTNILLTRRLSRYFVLSYPTIFLGCMIASTIYYFLGKVEGNDKEKFKFCLYWIIGILMLLPLRYGYEMDERIYTYSLIPMICILIISFKFNKNFLSAICIICIIMHIPASYAGESSLQTFSSDLNGGKFFANYAQISSPFFVHVGGDRYIIFHDPANVTNILHHRKDFVRWNPTTSALEEALYVIDSKHTNNILIYFFSSNFVREWLQEKQLDIIYTNGDYKIHYNRIQEKLV